MLTTVLFIAIISLCITCFPKRSKEECLSELQKDSRLFSKYQSLDENWRKAFIDFMSGTKTFPLTYDSVFMKLFNPDVYPERLSRFISCVIGMPVIVVQILPQQESILDGSALLIMDILVQLEDGNILLNFCKMYFVITFSN